MPGHTGAYGGLGRLADLTSSGTSMTDRAEQDPISTPAMLGQFAADYLAGADPKTPLASPLFASLSGLPPLLIQVGTADLLLSDSERLATAAAQAGVDVTLQIGEGLPHVYQLLLGTPEAARPPSKWGSSCGPGFAHQTAHRQQAPRRPAHPLAAYRPASLLITPNGARRKAPTLSHQPPRHTNSPP